MDHAKIVAKYNEMTESVKEAGISFTTNETKDRIVLEGLKESKEFSTIQDLELFVEGFKVGYEKANTIKDLIG